MITERFDQEIGALLRSTESPVPQGAWAYIRRTLDAPAPASPAFQFMPALVVGLSLLSGLALYSSLSGPDVAPARPYAPLSAEAAEVLETPQPDNATLSQKPEDETLPAEEPALGQQASPVNNKGMSSVATAGKYDASAHTFNGELSNNAFESAMTAQQGAESPAPKVSPQQIASAAASPALPARPVANTPEAKLPVAPSPQAATPRLQAAIQATNLSGYAPFEIDFKAVGHYDDVEWDFGPYGKSTMAHTPRTFDKPGVYTVVLSAFNAAGDVVSDMVTIEVHEGSNLVVPDSFTPNGDGINDHFKAEGVNIEHFQLTVIDSRGKLVFETRNILQPWVYEGYPSGPVETYIAIITARGVDGRDYNIRQRINVIF